MLDLLGGLHAGPGPGRQLSSSSWAGPGWASPHSSSRPSHSRSEKASQAGATTFVIGRIGDLGLLGAMLMLFDGLSRAGAPVLTFRGNRSGLPVARGAGRALARVVEREYAAAARLRRLRVGAGGAHEMRAAAAAFLASQRDERHRSRRTRLMQSTTTVVAGIYVLLRFSFLLETAPVAMQLLIVAGAATMLLASLAAATQLDVMPRRRLLDLEPARAGGRRHRYRCLLDGHLPALDARLREGAPDPRGRARGDDAGRRDGPAPDGRAGQKMRWTQGIFALACVALVGLPPFANFFPIEELLAFLWISGRPASDAGGGHDARESRAARVRRWGGPSS